MTKIKIPESKGKFRRDVYEKAISVIGQLSDDESPYRAFGENRQSQKGDYERMFHVMLKE